MSIYATYFNSNITTPIPTTDGGTGLTSYTTGDILYASATNTLSTLPIGTDPLEPLITDGTNVRYDNIRDVVCYKDDFIGNWDTTSCFGAFSWFRQAQNGGGIESPTGDVTNLHPGLLRFRTGTTSGWGGVATYDYLTFGNGEVILEFCFKSINVGDVTNDFSLYLGFGDKIFNSNPVPNDGIYFFYNQATNSGNWVARTVNGGTTTSANSTVALDTDYHIFRIVVNADATSVSFFIDGTEISNSPVTTNIPSLVGLQFSIQHVAGAERKCLIDYVVYKNLLTVSR